MTRFICITCWLSGYHQPSAGIAKRNCESTWETSFQLQKKKRSVYLFIYYLFIGLGLSSVGRFLYVPIKIKGGCQIELRRAVLGTLSVRTSVWHVVISRVIATLYSVTPC